MVKQATHAAKEVKSILAEAKRQGFEVEHKPGGHIQVRGAKGGLVHLPAAPGGRGLQNALSELRNIGLEYGHDGGNGDKVSDTQEREQGQARAQDHGCLYCTQTFKSQEIASLHTDLGHSELTQKERLYAVAGSKLQQEWTTHEMAQIANVEYHASSSAISKLANQGYLIRVGRGTYTLGSGEPPARQRKPSRKRQSRKSTPKRQRRIARLPQVDGAVNGVVWCNEQGEVHPDSGDPDSEEHALCIELSPNSHEPLFRKVDEFAYLSMSRDGTKALFRATNGQVWVAEPF